MKETANGILLHPIIKAILITLTIVAIMQTITSGIFVYKIHNGYFPTKIEVNSDHQRLQDSVNVILIKLDKPTNYGK